MGSDTESATLEGIPFPIVLCTELDAGAAPSLRRALEAANIIVLWEPSVLRAALVALYRWLVAKQGVVETRLDLHNRTAAGDALMKKLRKAEKTRLRKRLKLTGDKLERALSWSDMDCGPHALVGNRTLLGEELVVFPDGESDPANVRF